MPELYFQEFPGPEGAAPLVVLHGLFGSSANWRGIARKLSSGRRVLVPDMRNHGRSFKDRVMTYREMARDVLDTLDAEGIREASLVGHSMGGKAAMVAALENSDRVERLAVVDIAPVVYTHTHLPLIEAMMALDVDALASRSQADEALKPAIGEPMVRQFLLQSLEKADRGYRWRLNLDALKHGMNDLIGFPDLPDARFDRPVLFAYGSDSTYVQREHRTRIEHFFPNAEYAPIENAGHWVHADQPEVLTERLDAFLLEG